VKIMRHLPTESIWPPEQVSMMFLSIFDADEKYVGLNNNVVGDTAVAYSKSMVFVRFKV
jgi:hypothetical protein